MPSFSCWTMRLHQLLLDQIENAGPTEEEEKSQEVVYHVGLGPKYMGGGGLPILLPASSYHLKRDLISGTAGSPLLQ